MIYHLIKTVQMDLMSFWNKNWKVICYFLLAVIIFMNYFSKVFFKYSSTRSQAVSLFHSYSQCLGTSTMAGTFKKSKKSIKELINQFPEQFCKFSQQFAKLATLVKFIEEGCHFISL